MKSFCFTFGVGQYHGLLADYYVQIDAPDLDTARDVMHAAFGTRWSMHYEASEFEELVKQFPAYTNLCKRLGHLDQHGNRL